MIRILSAILLALTVVPFAAESASANCKPGNPNCVMAGSNRPKFCNPCKIDAGLGSQCKNTNTCGVKK